MIKKLLFIVLGTALSVQAQRKYGLQECVDVALRNNLQLQQGLLQVEGGENILESARYQQYPSLNFSGGQGVQSGRNIDPYTNQFVEKAIGFNSFGLNAGVALFNGFQLKNTIKQSKQNLEATQKELQATKNTVSLNVANAYLNLLNNYEQLDATQLQIQATRLQLERTTKLVNAGTLAQIALYDLQAQLANDELTIVNAQNSIEIAKLTLKQLMNLPANESLEVVRVQLNDPSLAPYDTSLDQIYNAAVKYLPDVEAAQMRVESAKTGIEIAKAAQMPTLSLGGGVNTNYSTAAPPKIFVGDGGQSTVLDVPSTTSYVQYAGVKLPVIDKVTIPSGSLKDLGYFNQLDNNRNLSLNLSLRVPIFNGYRARIQTAGAKIQQKNAELQVQIIKNGIRQNVEQAYYSMLNASKRYSAISNQVKSLEQTFRAAETRLNAGAINSLDYNIAKTNFDRAKANQIQAKYDFIFRTKILDFYQNKPLILE